MEPGRGAGKICFKLFLIHLHRIHHRNIKQDFAGGLSTCEGQLVLSSIPDGVTGLPLVQLLIALQIRPGVTCMRLQGAPRPLRQRLQAPTQELASAIVVDVALSGRRQSRLWKQGHITTRAALTGLHEQGCISRAAPNRAA